MSVIPISKYAAKAERSLIETETAMVYCDERIRSEDYVPDTRGYFARLFNRAAVQMESESMELEGRQHREGFQPVAGNVPRDPLGERLIARLRRDGAWDLFRETRMTPIANHDYREKAVLYVDLEARGLSTAEARARVESFTREPAPPMRVSPFQPEAGEPRSGCQSGTRPVYTTASARAL